MHLDLPLARADGPTQQAVVGRQFAGRVGLFLRMDDVDAHLEQTCAAGVDAENPLRRVRVPEWP